MDYLMLFYLFAEKNETRKPNINKELHLNYASFI